jgi:hypothetical protein
LADILLAEKTINLGLSKVFQINLSPFVRFKLPIGVTVEKQIDLNDKKM